MLENKGSKAPVICYVTDRKAFGAAASVESVLEKIGTAITAGVDCVQIREKDLQARPLLELARQAVREATERKTKEAVATRIIVNDRLDVALAAHAAGVHLGHESVPVGDVVRWCRAGNAPPGFLIGISCHSRDEVKEAETTGADYIFFGPIYETPSKIAFGAPRGIARLTEVCRGSRIPVIAIGGIGEENAAECIGAGAAGIAAIRLFQEAKAAEALKRVVERLHGTP